MNYRELDEKIQNQIDHYLDLGWRLSWAEEVVMSDLDNDIAEVEWAIRKAKTDIMGLKA